MSNNESTSAWDQPPELPGFPRHSQSVERRVKLVTEACQNVCSFGNRHALIASHHADRKGRKRSETVKHKSRLHHVIGSVLKVSAYSTWPDAKPQPISDSLRASLTDCVSIRFFLFESWTDGSWPRHAGWLENVRGRGSAEGWGGAWIPGPLGTTLFPPEKHLQTSFVAVWHATWC